MCDGIYWIYLQYGVINKIHLIDFFPCNLQGQQDETESSGRNLKAMMKIHLFGVAEESVLFIITI